MPEEDNWKHTPISYRNKEVGDIYLKYKGLSELMNGVRTFKFPSNHVRVLTAIIRRMDAVHGFVSPRQPRLVSTSHKTLCLA